MSNSKFGLSFRALAIASLVMLPIGAIALLADGPTCVAQKPRYTPGFGTNPNDEAPRRVPGFGENMIPLETIWTTDQINYMEKYFVKYERTKDGKLDRRELKVPSWGLDALEDNDANRDGVLDRHELMDFLARRRGWQGRAGVTTDTKKAEKHDPLTARYGSRAANSARSLIRRYDTNKNGLLDKSEVAKVKWSTPISKDDKNRDGRISETELASRLSRLEKEREKQKALAASKSSRPNRSTWDLASNLVSRFDTNSNRELEELEWRRMGVTVAPGDSDRDGKVSREELSIWLTHQDIDFTEIAVEMPEWFKLMDENLDGQVQMSEYETDWTAEKMSEFEKFDLNCDGIITSSECLEVDGNTGGKYRNDEMTLIGARAVISSEIEVEDDVLIEDLNIQISVTHTYDEYLDCYLIGPDDEQIELFTAVGKNDDHFENTILDDEATNSISKGRPPFAGTYRPEAVDKRDISLTHYKGKSARGTWRLMLSNARGDRPGALNRWSLLIEESDPEEEETVSTPLTERERLEGF